jgi:hypothetical protein
MVRATNDFRFDRPGRNAPPADLPPGVRPLSAVLPEVLRRLGVAEATTPAVTRPGLESPEPRVVAWRFALLPDATT